MDGDMDILPDQHSNVLGSWSGTFTANSSTAHHRRPQHRRHASQVSPAAAIPSDQRPHGTVDAQQHIRARGTSPHSVVSDVLPNARYSPRTNAHMKRLSMLSKPFSFSNISHSQSSSDERDRPASSPSVTPPTRPLLRSETSPLPRPSPTLKRKPPASHSSYGIDTSTGPPPSYSTLSQERLRPQERVVQPISPNITAKNSTGSDQSSERHERPVSTSKRNSDLLPDLGPTTERPDKPKRASRLTRSGSLARASSDTRIPTASSQGPSSEHSSFQNTVPALQNVGYLTAQPGFTSHNAG
jgi:hypothetical protein